MSASEVVIIEQSDAETMTGWQLLDRIAKDTGKRLTSNRSQMVVLGGRKWRVWWTVGRGKVARVTYVNLIRDTIFKIVNPDGTDTGDRMPGKVKARGKASDLLVTYKEV